MVLRDRLLALLGVGVAVLGSAVGLAQGTFAPGLRLLIALGVLIAVAGLYKPRGYQEQKPEPPRPPKKRGPGT